MTIDKHSEHASFPPAAPSKPSAINPTGNTWMMDQSARNKLLKKYKTQVASGTSTLCATLAVVSGALVKKDVLYILIMLPCRLLWRMSKRACKREYMRGDLLWVMTTNLYRHNFGGLFQCVRYLWRTEGPRGYVAGKLTSLQHFNLDL